MRRIVVLLAALGPTCAVAQIPDVQLKADITLHLRKEVDGDTSLRWYDTFGRYSTIAFLFALEPGFSAYVSQRLEKIPNDGDPSQIDESYVEDLGNWRIGKQYLPFGAGRILRESVTAARSETNVTWIPVTIAAADGGSGRQRGIVGRAGSKLGVSFAFGRHFGISGSSLTVVRRPEQSNGKGAGYGRVLGMDYASKSGVILIHGELALLRDGRGEDSEDREVFDIGFTLQPSPSRSLTMAWSRATNPRLDFIRLQGTVGVAPNVSAEWFVRTREGALYDYGASLRVRL